jgi:histidine triad (HIT) family protein
MLDEACLFCKIVLRKIPAAVVHETGGVLAFNDIKPQAPVHILFVPKTHVPGVDEIGQQNAAVVGDLVTAANQVARERGIAQTGYRLVINCKDDGGQTVGHLHLHLLGGRAMHWPPG